MTFIVEDGTGVPNANALVDVAFVDRYAEDMGAEWGIDESVPPLAADQILLKKQQAIVAGSRWIAARYVWRYDTKDPDQFFPVPLRFDSTSDDYRYPTKIKFAVCEAAIRVFRGDILAPDLERGGQITSEKIGPLAFTYDKDAPGTTKFTAIDDYVRDYTLGSNGNSFIRTERV